ncbi:MAG: flagellar hook-length control protein FliK [Beijerinckiaceae bacterium]
MSPFASSTIARSSASPLLPPPSTAGRQTEAGREFAGRLAEANRAAEKRVVVDRTPIERLPVERAAIDREDRAAPPDDIERPRAEAGHARDAASDNSNGDERRSARAREAHAANEARAETREVATPDRPRTQAAPREVTSTAPPPDAKAGAGEGEAKPQVPAAAGSKATVDAQTTTAELTVAPVPVSAVQPPAEGIALEQAASETLVNASADTAPAAPETPAAAGLPAPVQIAMLAPVLLADAAGSVPSGEELVGVSAPGASGANASALGSSVSAASIPAASIPAASIPGPSIPGPSISGASFSVTTAPGDATSKAVANATPLADAAEAAKTPAAAQPAASGDQPKLPDAFRDITAALAGPSETSATTPVGTSATPAAPSADAAQAARVTDPAASLTRADQPVPLQAFAVEIGMRALRGAKEFAIRLDPEDLGRVDVNLSIDDKGEVKATLVVERPETLQLLQRDARTLERAFDQAGLKTNPDGLQFSLRDPGQQGRGRGDDGKPSFQGQNAGREDALPEIALQPVHYRRISASGLDIRI